MFHKVYLCIHTCIVREYFYEWHVLHIAACVRRLSYVVEFLYALNEQKNNVSWQFFLKKRLNFFELCVVTTDKPT